MLGFVIGAACLIGLVKVLRHGGLGRHGHGYGWGGRHMRFGPRAVLRRLFQRLDTTPGQEKVIFEALGDLRAKAGDAKGELLHARADVAGALRQESFDEVLLGAALTTRLDGSIEVLRKGALDAFGKVHAALDERQRNTLADLVESGGKRGFRGHPYRL